MIKFLLSSVCLSIVGSVLSVSAFAQTGRLDDGDFEKQLIESSKPKKTSYLKQTPKAKEEVIPVTVSGYKKDLLNALLYHNLMNSISSLEEQIEPFRLAVLDKEVTAKKVKDFDSCNVQMFSPFFANPTAVWSKLKSETQKGIENYNASVAAKAQNLSDSNASVLAASSSDEREVQIINGRKRYVSSSAQGNLQNTTKSVVFTARAVAETKKMEEKYGLDVLSVPTGQSVSVSQESAAATAKAEQAWETNADFSDNVAPELDITMAVLNRFYPHQDSWGQRKTASTSSLPLWKDQKHLYNEKIWKPKYAAIRAYCAALEHPVIVTEPQVSDKIKYDYYFYDQVKKAHDTFVTSTEEKGCVLTAEMKRAPERAPRPLPLVEEEILVFKDGSGNIERIYPQNPKNPSDTVGAFKAGTLWEAYKADDYRGIASGGEFNRYFSVYKKTITPRPAINDIDGNRLSKYLEFKEDAENAMEVYRGYLAAKEELALSIEETAKTADIVLPENIDYFDKDDLKKVYDVFKAEKEKSLAAAERGMTDIVAKVEGMTAEQLQENKELAIEAAYLKALQTDKKAILQITDQKALEFDDAMKEAEANSELVGLVSDEANDYKLKTIKSKNYTADLSKSCLKPSKTQLVNLNLIEIK